MCNNRSEFSVLYYIFYVSLYVKAAMPDSAFISNFSMIIRGVEYVALVKEKNEAKKIYTDQVKAGRGAGLVETDARGSDLVVIQANVEPGDTILFRLTYDELLVRELGVYQQALHIKPEHEVQDFLVTVTIDESLPLKFINATYSNRINELCAIEIHEPIDNDPSRAAIYIIASKSFQREMKNDPEGHFQIAYDVDRKGQVSEIQVMDGYFVHFFALEDSPSLPKFSIFVLDVSGSMGGDKIAQLKAAMTTILSEMRNYDFFIIVTFQSHTESKTEILQATNQNKEFGIQIINSLQAGGGTELNQAMMTSLKIARQVKLDEKFESDVQTMIFFLTDGLGNTGMDTVLNDVKLENRDNISIYTVAFGDDADLALMRAVAQETSGISRSDII